MYFGDARFELLLRSVKTADSATATSTPATSNSNAATTGSSISSPRPAFKSPPAAASRTSSARPRKSADAEGPSGFSFTDIAADRAGVRFAEVATASERSARKLQDTLAGSQAERDFFPKVGDLPEGLSEADFKSAYGDLDTETYNAMIRAIDNRIAKVALYK